jgi:hypothetical protein
LLIGMVPLATKPRALPIASNASTAGQRANSMSRDKMVAANALPPHVLLVRD